MLAKVVSAVPVVPIVPAKCVAVRGRKQEPPSPGILSVATIVVVPAKTVVPFEPADTVVPVQVLKL